MIVLSMHLLLLMNVMLEFICMRSVDLPGARGKRNNTRWKILTHNETRIHNLELRRQTIQPAELAGLDESSSFKVTFIHIPIGTNSS